MLKYIHILSNSIIWTYSHKNISDETDFFFISFISFS